MKTSSSFIVAIALTFLFVLIGKSDCLSQTQVRTKTTDTKKDMLCHKWNISNSNDAVALFPGQSVPSTIKFLPDGDVLFTAGNQVRGVWNYDETRNSLFILVNNKLWKYKVLSLTNQQMVIENTKYQSTIKNYLWRENL